MSEERIDVQAVLDEGAKLEAAYLELQELKQTVQEDFQKVKAEYAAWNLKYTALAKAVRNVVKEGGQSK